MVILALLIILLPKTVFGIFGTEVHNNFPTTVSKINKGTTYYTDLSGLANNKHLYCCDHNNSGHWSTSYTPISYYKYKGYIYVNTKESTMVSYAGNPDIKEDGTAIEIAQILANQTLTEDIKLSEARSELETLLSTKNDTYYKNNSYKVYKFLYPEQMAIWKVHGFDWGELERERKCLYEEIIRNYDFDWGEAIKFRCL